VSTRSLKMLKEVGFVCVAFIGVRVRIVSVSVKLCNLQNKVNLDKSAVL
jgi:hypothetical protein